MKTSAFFWLLALGVLITDSGCCVGTPMKWKGRSRVGESYVLKADVYLCSSINIEKRFFGINMGHDVSLPGLPSEVLATNVGKDFGGLKIEGVIPKGSVYTLQRLNMRREDFRTVISYVGDMRTTDGRVIDNLISDFVQLERYLENPMGVVFFSDIMDISRTDDLGKAN